MPHDLTIRQFAELALGKTEHPLHLGDIPAAYKEKFMMLKSTMRNLSRAKSFMFVTMISRLNVTNLLGNTPAEVQYAISQIRPSIAAGHGQYWPLWASVWLNGQALATANPLPAYVTLASALKSVDASIFYLSPEVSLPRSPDAPHPSGVIPGPGSMGAWTVIGIVGPFGGLANLKAQTISLWPDRWIDQDWDTIAKFASSDSDLLLAPAQLLPTIWQVAQGQVLNNLPDANMMLLPGS